MWLRLKNTGTAEYVADLLAAFALIDAGQAETIDELLARPEVEEAPEVDAPAVKPKERRK